MKFSYDPTQTEQEIVSKAIKEGYSPALKLFEVGNGAYMPRMGIIVHDRFICVGAALPSTVPKRGSGPKEILESWANQFGKDKSSLTLILKRHDSEQEEVIQIPQ